MRLLNLVVLRPSLLLTDSQGRENGIGDFKNPVLFEK